MRFPCPGAVGGWWSTFSVRVAAMTIILALLSPAAIAVQIGQPAPPLAIQGPDGSWQRLQDYRGRIVYLDFWASWCAPCRRALPEYARLERQWKSRGLSVLAVNVDTDSRAARQLLDHVPLGFPVVFDPKGIWAERFDLPTMPTSYLIDRKGIVRRIYAGFRPEELSALESSIDQVLRE